MKRGALPPSAPNPPLLSPHVFVKMYLPPTGKISSIPGAFSNISLLRSTSKCCDMSMNVLTKFPHVMPKILVGLRYWQQQSLGAAEYQFRSNLIFRHSQTVPCAYQTTGVNGSLKRKAITIMMIFTSKISCQGISHLTFWRNW